jgi:SAM-dependent methyltransferase
MPSFSDYAAYYDLFYRGKDYAEEATFVLRVLQERNPAVRRILELGCGTGGHALHLVESGCSVTGLDLSERMVQKALARFAALPPEVRDRFRASRGDAANFTLAEKHDAVVSLFHVASYQATNEALLGYFRSARGALGPGGLFLFDFWHGPGVLSDRPHARERIETAGDVTVTRTTRPQLLVNENVVEVNYTFSVTEGGMPKVEDFHEVHRMRYLFLPEIELLASLTGFSLVEAGRWMDRAPLTGDDWYGYVVLRAGATSAVL